MTYGDAVHRPISARRGLRTVVLALLATALLLPSTPASAGMEHYYDFTRDVATTPGDVPARTVVSVHGSVSSGVVTRVRAVIELGAEPTADTASRVHLVYGVRESAGAGCTIMWSKLIDTLTPTDGVRRDGARLLVDEPLSDYRYEDEWNCAELVVRESGGPLAAVTDHWHGLPGDQYIVDPAGFAKIVAVDHRRLPVDRWSIVRVEVVNKGDDSLRVIVGGSGRGLRVRGAVIEGPVLTGEHRVVRVPVRLRRDRAADLSLTARPMAGFDRTHTVEVRVRPRR
jgi:hypothetical protein